MDHLTIMPSPVNENDKARRVWCMRSTRRPNGSGPTAKYHFVMKVLFQESFVGKEFYRLMLNNMEVIDELSMNSRKHFICLGYVWYSFASPREEGTWGNVRIIWGLGDPGHYLQTRFSSKWQQQQKMTNILSTFQTRPWLTIKDPNCSPLRPGVTCSLLLSSDSSWGSSGHGRGWRRGQRQAGVSLRSCSLLRNGLPRLPGKRRCGECWKKGPLAPASW